MIFGWEWKKGSPPDILKPENRSWMRAKNRNLWSFRAFRRLDLVTLTVKTCDAFKPYHLSILQFFILPNCDFQVKESVFEIFRAILPFLNA